MSITTYYLNYAGTQRGSRVGAYGTGAYGIGAYGGVASVSFITAYASGSRRIRVVLSAPPQHISPYVEGDVLRTSTWNVQLVSTQEQITVVGVRAVRKDLFIYDIYLAVPIPGAAVAYSISSTTLRSASGILVVAPHSIQFMGVDLETASVAQKSPPVGIRDLKNDDLRGGGLAVTPNDGGHYVTHEGKESLTKRCYRRLVSRPGEWQHLGKKYGVGIVENEPLPATNVVELARIIEDQIRQEPDVRSVTVIPALIATEGVLYVELQVTDNFGNTQVVGPFKFEKVVI